MAKTPISSITRAERKKLQARESRRREKEKKEKHLLKLQRLTERKKLEKM